MKVFMIILFALYLPITADAAGICFANTKRGTRSTTPSQQEDGNRGYWIAEFHGAGESHCSKLSIITPANAHEFEVNGGWCWCRFTRVVAPNGYWANFSGGWVFAVQVSGGAERCTWVCPDSCVSRVEEFVSVPGRRAMLMTPYYEPGQ